MYSEFGPPDVLRLADIGKPFVLARGVFSRILRQRIRMFVAKTRPSDLAFLAGLCEAGKLTPIIDRSYPLADAAEAIRYLEAGHAGGKVIVIA